MKMQGAVFVVTGGASGIGEATVRMAIANGAKASIWDLNQKLGDKLVAEIGADKVLFNKVNVTSEKDVDAALAATVEKFGRVDVCVNCAGLGAALLTVSKKMEAHPIAAFNRIIQINLVGTFLCGSKCAAQMAKQAPGTDGERGLVVNIASVAAFDGQNGQAAYSASKSGVVGMTLPMARDMGKLGIRVNTICPGIVDTPLTGAKKPVDDRDPEKVHRLMKPLLTSQVFPNRRFGRPSEMASAVQFLTECTFMNGETLRVDAGVRMPKL
eukprot:TRINITY_DN633_c0_g3_i1.p2 TRINITY_DN633_c0_g3~~TRINITY_DN633_c0_g3_i1.p2  ORF type:complete len:269 (+),score=124.73 TRINITY_DN633_c0_g3_i1:67-873(+)